MGEESRGCGSCVCIYFSSDIFKETAKVHTGNDNAALRRRGGGGGGGFTKLPLLLRAAPGVLPRVGDCVDDG